MGTIWQNQKFNFLLGWTSRSESHATAESLRIHNIRIAATTRICRRPDPIPIQPATNTERKHHGIKRWRPPTNPLASELDLETGQEALVGGRERDGNGSRHLNPNDGSEL